MRHPFIKRAKRTTYLVELIERYREWKVRGGAGQHTDSESSSDEDNNDGRNETDGWVETIRDKNNVLMNSKSNDLVHLEKGMSQTNLNSHQLVTNSVSSPYYNENFSNNVNPMSTSVHNTNSNGTNFFKKLNENDESEYNDLHESTSFAQNSNQSNQPGNNSNTNINNVNENVLFAKTQHVR